MGEIDFAEDLREALRLLDFFVYDAQKAASGEGDDYGCLCDVIARPCNYCMARDLIRKWKSL